MDQNSNTWASIVHFSQFLAYIVPVLGIVAPIIIWQIKKDDPFIDFHGKEAVNFVITQFIIGLICGLLVLIGIGIILLALFGIYVIIYIVIVGIKASQGEYYQYPFCIRLIK
ncbi:DUF4870 domain-containing protein [bacterium]|nr:DUF4870 domain-containing protein [bacterium]